MPLNPNPEFLSQDEAHRSFVACGKIALFWGPIEMLIEQMVVLLRNRHNETDQRFPFSFADKARDLKRRLRREQEYFQDILDGILPLITHAKSLHKFRANIVHCYFQGQNLDGELVFGRSDQKRGIAYTDRDSRYLIDAIEAKAAEMIKLHDEIETLWRPLNGRVFKNLPQEIRQGRGAQ